MPTNRESFHSQIQAELKGLSPEAQAYIQHLERQRTILEQFELQSGYDYLEAQSLAFIAFLCSDAPPTGQHLDTCHNVFQQTIRLTRDVMEMFDEERLLNAKTVQL